MEKPRQLLAHRRLSMQGFLSVSEPGLCSVLFPSPEATSRASVVGLASVLAGVSRCKDTSETESAPLHGTRGHGAFLRVTFITWFRACLWSTCQERWGRAVTQGPQGVCSCMNLVEELVGNLLDSVRK